MIIRIAFFISLLALFYYYCKDGDNSINPYRETNDVNMIQVPDRINPAYNYDLIPEANWKTDTSNYLIYDQEANLEMTRQMLSSAQ